MSEGAVRRLSTGPKLAEQAYEALRADITSGVFAPGQRVTERALAVRLGVSPTPVREAISRLEQERLLERDGRALFVASPTADRRRDLVRIHAVLRGVAARGAAARATDRQLAAIARLHERAVQLTTREPLASVVEEGAKLTRLFHSKINDAAHHPMLVDMIATASAFDAATRLNAVSTLGDRYPAEVLHHEHAEIVAALRAHDGERADQLMVAHTLRTGAQYEEFVSGPPSAQR